MSTIKPYNELKRHNTLRKILKFLFAFFENNIRQADKIKSARSCMFRKLIFKIVSQLTLNIMLSLRYKHKNINQLITIDFFQIIFLEI